MKTTRKRYSAEFKAKVAVEAIREQKTTNEIAARYRVHPSQVTSWKKQAMEEMPQLFNDGRGPSQKQEEELKAELYQQIGQMKVELDWLKKKVGPVS
jgi:putative transposase